MYQLIIRLNLKICFLYFCIRLENRCGSIKQNVRYYILCSECENDVFFATFVHSLKGFLHKS